MHYGQRSYLKAVVISNITLHPTGLAACLQSTLLPNSGCVSLVYSKSELSDTVKRLGIANILRNRETTIL